MREPEGAMPLVDRVQRGVPPCGSTPSEAHLVGLLAEQSPIYAGRSSRDAERLRGQLMAGFETYGLPEAAVPIVIEQLETGIAPYPIAAAAKALRGARDISPSVVALLVDCIERLRGCDDVVRFGGETESGAPATALIEVLRTIAWLGSRAAAARADLLVLVKQNPPEFSSAVCAEMEKTLGAIEPPPAEHSCCSLQPATQACCAIAPAPVAVDPAAGMDIVGVELQDQDGEIISFGRLFAGRPSVLSFFYTRCMNPNKCSLTVSKLARLQRRLAEDGIAGQINVAAITYDPAFDLPARLAAYGSHRTMAFDSRNRILRTTGPFAPLQRRFDLGVGYDANVVNQHRLELIVLDADMRLFADFSRVSWEIDELVTTLKRVPSGSLSGAVA